MVLEKIYQEEFARNIESCVAHFNRERNLIFEYKNGTIKSIRTDYANHAEQFEAISYILLFLNRQDDYFACIDLALEYSWLHLKEFKDKMEPALQFMNWEATHILSTTGILSRRKNKLMEYLKVVNEEMDKIPDDHLEEKYGLAKGLMIRDIILGDWEKAKRNMPKYQEIERQTFPRHLHGPKMAEYFEAFLERDAPRVISQIQKVIKYKSLKYRDERGPPISLDAIFYTLFAMDNGIRINPQTEFSPDELRFMPGFAFVKSRE
jgi:hypothetical protein